MLNGMNDIVVVDDNPLLLDVLSEIFKGHGYAVRTALNGFAALAVIRDRVPNILLSDLNMPHMSGFELLSVVRRRFPAIAVIAMSGEYSGVMVPAGVAADGFYAKGSRSVARLFEILNAIKDVEMREATRSVAPVWIPGTRVEQGNDSAAVACPECLRTFSHCLNAAECSRHECRCPHCLHPVQLAIVRELAEMDKTAVAGSTTANQIGKSSRELQF
jgi:CheY-like chemotaxis protein